MNTLTILVGSTSGTADSVAHAIAMDCADLVAHIDVQPMDLWEAAQLAQHTTPVLVCCATHGSGDVPDNAAGLYTSLLHNPAYLGHLRYGVISLGDLASYPQTFAMGGQRFDTVLQDLGARRLGEPCLLDASADDLPESVAIAWCRQWLHDWRDQLA